MRGPDSHGGADRAEAGGSSNAGGSAEKGNKEAQGTPCPSEPVARQEIGPGRPMTGIGGPGHGPLPDTVAEALQGDRDAWLAEAGRVGATAAVGAELVPGAAMAQSRIGKTFTAAHVMALGRSALLQDEGSR